MRNARFAAALACILIGMLPAAAAAEESPGGPATDWRQLFDSANASFRDALAAKDKTAARTLLGDAIVRWQALIDEAGIRNPKLYVNIGNAALLAGDTGRAVAAYRRAERLDATDPGVRAGLEAARRQAGTTAPVPLTWSEKALQRAGYLPRRALLTTFAILWIGGWTALLARLLGALASRRLAPTLLLLGALSASPVVAAEALDSRLVHAVVVARAPAFNGPSDAVYQPTFKDGLPTGVEVRVLAERSGWTRVRLGDGQETWVRAADLERI
jgi:hypothetical protein